MSPSVFKHPHYAAEVEDWLANRATAAEAARFRRYFALVEQAGGTHHKQQHTQVQSVKQQQQQRRCSSAAAAGAAITSAPWGHATTTTAAAAAARTSHTHQLLASGRPGSAVPTQTAAAVPPLALGRPATAAAAVKPQPQQQPDMQALSARGSAATVGARSLYVTTSAAMHGLKDLYSDLWDATVPICRPDAAPNRNFVSEWGESLKQGSAEAARRYMATTSQLANLQVAKPTDEFAVRADSALVAWAAKQHTYTHDLLAPRAEAAVAALLDGGSSSGSSSGSSTGSGSQQLQEGVPQLSLAERKELLQVLRQVAAVVQPNRFKSTSHMMHCRQESVEQAATTALLKQQTRIRTMGAPRKVAVKGFNRPAASARAGQAAASGASDAMPWSLQAGAGRATPARCAGRPGGAGSAGAGHGSHSHGGPRASDLIDTQKSRVPLKWAASSIVPASSSYADAFGAHPGRSPQMFVTKFREVNVAMGHVDQHLHPAGSRVYPVEALYLSLPAKHAAQHQDTKTTYRAAFPATAATASAGLGGSTASGSG